MSEDALPWIMRDGFYCNRQYAGTTSLTAGGLAARSVNILFQVCLLLHGPARLSRLASWRFHTSPCEKYGLGLRRALVPVAKHQGHIS